MARWTRASHRVGFGQTVLRRAFVVVILWVSLMSVATSCTAEEKPAPVSQPAVPPRALGSPRPAGPTPTAPQPPPGIAQRPGYPERFGFGENATPERIKDWDIDVRPDGAGLPPGTGTVARGGEVYAAKCAVCHGPTGRGTRDAPRLVTIDPETRRPDPLNLFSIGNYWPYATTVYDYINRAMPINAPGSLNSEEVYSLVAWLLQKNGITGEHEVMNAQTLPEVKMPALTRMKWMDLSSP